jgi:hypothetical protein
MREVLESGIYLLDPTSPDRRKKEEKGGNLDE